MARLYLRLLGPFQASLNGEEISDFESDKERALLTYLTIEADRPHAREALAEMFWPERPERAARGNLRHTLTRLRKSIRDYDAIPNFLEITRQTIGFNPTSDAWIDAKAFTQLVAGEDDPLQDMRQLEKAVELYQGDFLEGLSLADSIAFEEWALLKREWLRRLMLKTLHRLASYHEGRGDYERGLGYAWRQVELEPWEEEGYRGLMRLLALSGRRSDALAQYEACERVLRAELDVEPSAETQALYQRIRGGELGRADLAPRDWVIRGYELRECLGSGHYGAVYRAHQPVVGRDVAIKVILPEYANHPDFIRRFEAEAQLVARLEHPHIVPLYDYWREPDSAYLVMRWLRGGNLRAALTGGPWEISSALLLTDQIADALTIAHRQGVVHRDLKPANILLDEESNAYLSDFGVATLAASLDASQEIREETALIEPLESLGYVSPELTQGEKPTTAADIYSFGVVLYEVLAGQHPFSGVSGEELSKKHLLEPLPSVQSQRPELPPEVDTVIQRATAKAPDERYPDPQALAEDFRQAIAPLIEILPSKPKVELAVQNPYKGLRPFQEADAADFFGRETLTERLLTRLGEEGQDGRFLAIVGPSGSGKSSVVKAGLVPALRRGRLPGSESWFVVETSLGIHPLEELATALLGVAVEPVQSLLDWIRSDERGLLGVIQQALPGEKNELLLVIDQFEELFTLVDDEGERVQYMEHLVSAITDPESRVRVVITLRADFYDRPLRYPEIAQLLRQNTEVVLPLTPEELELAITRPAERAGLRLEPGLLSEIISDVSDQPGTLPLLQYTLTEVFERRAGDSLTLEAYQTSGGVMGALARRAETLFEETDENSQEAVRQIFLRLVTLGEGVEDTRRRVPRSELIALISDHRPATKDERRVGKLTDRDTRLAGSNIVDEVIERYGWYRLLTFDRDPETRAPTVEVAHEALLREWDRLREWIDASRDDLRAYQRLSGAAIEWLNAGRDASFLLRGSRMGQFEIWSKETSLALSQTERDYLEASLAEERKRQAVEAARLERERALERRSRNFLRALAVVLFIATIGALGLAWLARSAQVAAQEEAQARATQQVIAQSEANARATQQTIAQHQAHIAAAREFAMASISNLDVDPELSILLALQAANETFEIDQTYLPETEDALHKAVQASRVLLTIPHGTGVAFSPDGSRLATAGPDNTARIWDSNTGQELLTLTSHDEAVVNLIFSPEGTRLATTSYDGTAKIWDSETGELTLTLSGHTNGLISPAFSPDGDLLATTSLDGTARVWDAKTGKELHTLPHAGLTGGVAFSPDGNLLAIADHDAYSAKVWDVESGQELLTLAGHTEGLNDLAFSPDGSRLATVSSDNTAKIWDVASGEELLTMEGHNGFVFGVDFSPDGMRLATGSVDATAKVWDAETGRELLTLAGHSAGIQNVAFSPDGKRLVSGSGDGVTKVWDITPQGSRELLTLAGHTDVVFRINHSPDGKRLATSSFDGTSKVWDLSSGEEIFTLSGHTGLVYDTPFSPDGTRLASVSADGMVITWDAETGQELLTIDAGCGVVFNADYSPDGSQLAIACENGTAKVWDAKSGEALLTLERHQGDMFSDVFGVAWSPGGGTLATAGWDGLAKLWEAGSGKELAALSGHLDQVNSVAFSPDGRYLATSSWDGTAKTWDVESGEEVHTLTGHSGVIWVVEFSPDGTQLATSSFDSTAKLWDFASGKELLTLTGHEVGLGGLSYSPDGKYLAVGGGDGTVRIYVLPMQELISLAQERVTRSLTEKECQQYLHVDKCPPTP